MKTTSVVSVELGNQSNIFYLQSIDLEIIRLDYFNNSWNGSIGESSSLQMSYKSFFSRNNTPYIEGSSAGPVRRLWCYLVEQECVQDVFIKIVLNKRSCTRRKSMHSENIATSQGKVIEHHLHHHLPAHFPHWAEPALDIWRRHSLLSAHKFPVRFSSSRSFFIVRSHLFIGLPFLAFTSFAYSVQLGQNKEWTC